MDRPWSENARITNYVEAGHRYLPWLRRAVAVTWLSTFVLIAALVVSVVRHWDER